MPSPGDQVTHPGHVQYGSLLIGPGTPYGWQSLTGWADSPTLDSGTVPRADAHGALPGRLLAQPRTITLDGLIVRTAPGAMTAAVRHLAAATGPVADELPLVVRLDTAPPLLCWARCIRRSVPVGTGGYAIGIATEGALQWEATDPRRYEVDEQRASARLPAAEPGLDWGAASAHEGLRWPLEFGEPGSTGALSATNTGDAPTHPTITIRGPVTRPALTCLETGDTLEYDITLATNDTLTVDTAAGTVVLNGTANRLYSATTRSMPEQSLALDPGVSGFIFRAAPGSTDPRASCTMRWRSAYW